MAAFLRSGPCVIGSASSPFSGSMRKSAARHHLDVLLLSAQYPPTVGGSATLFYEAYRRLQHPNVRVMTDAVTQRAKSESCAIIERQISTPYWGLARPGAISHHWSVAQALKTEVNARPAIVHCGRALPEGVAAWLGRKTGGPRYVCWAHGEDL